MSSVIKYLGVKDKGGPTIKVTNLKPGTTGGGGLKGNVIKIDVKQIEALNNPSENGAATLAHESRHNIDTNKSGEATLKDTVRGREINAYRTEKAAWNGLHFNALETKVEFDKAVESSVKAWEEK